jgi:hypothetical protein
MPIEPEREFDKERVVIEEDRGPREGFRDVDPEVEFAGPRDRGCCRIRRKPEAPRPCSCSVKTVDLSRKMWSAFVSYTLRHQRHQVRVQPRPAAPTAHVTNLDMGSCSVPECSAPNENRIRAFSGPDGVLEEYARRFPVLRFLGIVNSLGGSVRRPRACSSCLPSPTRRP